MRDAEEGQEEARRQDIGGRHQREREGAGDSPGSAAGSGWAQEAAGGGHRACRGLLPGPLPSGMTPRGSQDSSSAGSSRFSSQNPLGLLSQSENRPSFCFKKLLERLFNKGLYGLFLNNFNNLQREKESNPLTHTNTRTHTLKFCLTNKMHTLFYKYLSSLQFMCIPMKLF